jgi:hypothetical protein
MPQTQSTGYHLAAVAAASAGGRAGSELVLTAVPAAVLVAVLMAVQMVAVLMAVQMMAVLVAVVMLMVIDPPDWSPSHCWIH